ncbi:MAG: phospholipid carrier-dependent glycosyltransferase [Lentisphaeria bacterium]|nr:phospholipid carrier-dependent glycosyltransferase [Lentisphaeria bacterium]
MKKVWLYPLIAVVILTVYILPLGGRPLITPDEARYAEIPREMLLSGNWVSPRLNGVRYFEKTPFSYWAFAVSFKLFGMNRFALRLPCMLSMLGTAWIIFLLMSQYYDRRTALLGATIFAALPFVAILASVAITDMFLTLFVTGVTVTGFLAAQENISWKRRIVLLILCGICCGLAFLTKGFLAFAVPAVTLVPYLIWDKKWKMLFILPWIPLVVMLLVAGPWCLAIHRQEPDFWHYFFFVEHLNRFFGREKAQHAKSFFYFFPVFAGAIALWVLMLPNLCKELYRQVKDSPLLKLCSCGVILPFLLFSCSSGKLATYILPCLPPTAILIAAGAQKFFVEERRDTAFHLTLLIFTIAFPVVILLILANMATAWPEPFFCREDWPQIVLLAVVSLMAITGFYLSWKAVNRYAKLFLLQISMFPVLIGANFIFPAMFREWKAPILFLESVYPDIPKNNRVIVTNRRPFQDVCWAFRTTDMRMYAGRNEIEYGLGYPEAKNQFIPDFDALEALYWNLKKQKWNLVLVTPLEEYPFFEKRLPKPVWVKKSHPGLIDGYIVALY